MDSAGCRAAARSSCRNTRRRALSAPLRRASPEQAILAIDSKRVAARCGRLAVRGTGDQQAVQFLQAVSTTGELRSEPVKQFGMRWSTAVEAEVVRRVDQADAEMVVPYPVDDHPSEERVIAMRDPAGERRAALGLGGIGDEREIAAGPRHCGDPAGCDRCGQTAFADDQLVEQSNGQRICGGCVYEQATA